MKRCFLPEPPAAAEPDMLGGGRWDQRPRGANDGDGGGGDKRGKARAVAAPNAKDSRKKRKSTSPTPARLCGRRLLCGKPARRAHASSPCAVCLLLHLLLFLFLFLRSLLPPPSAVHRSRAVEHSCVPRDCQSSNATAPPRPPPPPQHRRKVTAHKVGTISANVCITVPSSVYQLRVWYQGCESVCVKKIQLLCIAGIGLHNRATTARSRRDVLSLMHTFKMRTSCKCMKFTVKSRFDLFTWEFRAHLGTVGHSLRQRTTLPCLFPQTQVRNSSLYCDFRCGQGWGRRRGARALPACCLGVFRPPNARCGGVVMSQ